MKRYDFIKSIEAAIPYFFPEMEGQTVWNSAFIDFRSNNLMFSITFHKDSFELSQFNSKLNKFNLFLEFDGIKPIDNLIEHKVDEEKNAETYFYRVPLSITQGFTD